jgi:hypothetical protein
MVKKIVALFITLLVPFTGLALFLSVIPFATAQKTAQNDFLEQPTLVQTASLSLTKTVGTDPALCASSQSITLPVGGGDVTYCYRVTNIGDVTLTRHTLTDDQLGTVLSNFNYSLTPGASAFLTQTTEITVTTVNSATWIGFNPGPVDETSDTDTAEVIVPVPEPAIVLTKTVGTDPAVCASTKSLALPVGGGDVFYCYRVTNTGNITLTRHTLVDDQLGTVLSNFNYSLTPGASAFITQTKEITITTVNSATWAAFNPGPIDTANGTDVATVFVGSRLFLPVILRE